MSKRVILIVLLIILTISFPGCVKDSLSPTASDEDVSSAPDEDVSSAPDEDISSASDEDVSSASDEDISSASDEDVSSASDKDVLSSNNKGDSDDTLSNEEILLLYEEFLQGDRAVVLKDGLEFITDFQSKGGRPPYGFHDVNGDGIVELHILGPALYRVIFYDQQELRYWSIFTLYSKPTTTNNCFLYHRPGAPPHDNYQFQEFDFYGNQLLHVSFSRYDWHLDGNYDERDLYIFEGTEVSKDEWDELTAEYLAAETVLIDWHRS